MGRIATYNLNGRLVTNRKPTASQFKGWLKNIQCMFEKKN